ncbi:MAG: transketolase [Eubacteriales bacterium]|nr:transketolase [Eubacteriales bacterium]
MNKLDQLTVTTIRMLAVDGIEKANSGHPGLPLGAAPAAYAVWTNMTQNPSDPTFANRDRFVLSAGHGSMLLYSMLHLFGYGLTIEDLKNFRQLGSKTPGHPEYGHTVGVETTTGPLGQGIANAVGMAMAEAHLAARFNRPGYPVVDHYTYALCGDGCLMEGISGEASSLAGTLKLGKLILVYDDNDISIEGSTDTAFTEDVGKRYEAYGWQVLRVADGNDLDALNDAVLQAKADADRPSIIIVKTLIGYGCPDKQGKANCHGSPLGAEHVKATRAFYSWPDEDFHVPAEVYEHMKELRAAGETAQAAWETMFRAYAKDYPELADQWSAEHTRTVDEKLLDDADFMSFAGPDATRNASGIVLNRLAAQYPEIMGGSADLAPSNMSDLKNESYFSADNYAGRNLHFGVREHAMAAIVNGMAVHGGLKPYAATFFVFCDYMKHAMRLAAIMKLPVVYILTHDSIGVGEDGPTHEPIEQLPMLRSIPGFTVYRPADSRETAAAWIYALNADGPTALVLTRQKLPLYECTGKNALKGAYIMKEGHKAKPDIILMASGSEVELIFKASDELAKMGISARVVSMPSWEVFDRQSDAYKRSVLPDEVRARLAVEAASPFGWHKYVGLDGEVLAMEGYGASGPAPKLFEHFGFTVKNVVERALVVLSK